MKKRTMQFIIRQTEDEWCLLNKKVKQTGMSREAYIRLLLKDRIPIAIPMDIFYEVHSELCKIGNNLNQIVYRAQALQMIDASSYRDNANRLFDVCEKLIEATHPVRSG